MSETNKPTAYRCSFCRNSLSKLPLGPPDWPWLLLLLRPVQCPHCFVVYRRPLRWISYLPGVKWIANHFTGKRKTQKGMLTDTDVGGPIVKFIAGIGRRVQAIESGVAKCVGFVASAIWSSLTWLPNRLMGRKSRRKRSRGRGRFLKSK